MRRLLQCVLVWLAVGAAIPAFAAGPEPTDDPKYCGGCHQRIYNEYSKSVMGTDLADPKSGERGPQHWGGLPGRLYAKPLQTPPDPATGKPRLGVGGFAAERIASDTTLKYREPERAQFRFRLPPGSQPVKVQARLVYRWAFIGLADAKGWPVDDRLMRVALREVRRN